MTNDDSRTPDAPPTGSSTAAPTGAAPAPTEWRVPMDDPRPWARGKTASELLALSDQMANAITTLAYQAPAQQAPAPAAYAPSPVQPLDDDEIIDGKRMRQILGAVVANQQPVQDDQTAFAVYQTAMALARQNDPEAFASYGPEIEANIAQLPLKMRTLENIRQIVRIVKADHVEELAERRARDLAAQQGLTVRTSGAAPNYAGANTSVLESDELPAAYRSLLAKKGITETQLRDFCRANGMTVDQWFKQAKGHTNIIGEE